MKLFDIFKRGATKSGSEMREYLLSEIKRVIDTWDTSDIYAVSLYVEDNGDNPCEPTVTLGYNTEEHFKAEAENRDDKIEVRWNYAYWQQNREYFFGLDEVTQPVVERWINSKGFKCYTYEEMFLSDKEPAPETYEGITQAFVNELVAIVKELHKSGFIKAKFGKDIPVLIHELEYYEEIADQNIKANPPHTVDEFVAFCLDEY